MATRLSFWVKDFYCLQVVVSPSNFEVAQNIHVPMSKDQKGSKDEEEIGTSMRIPINIQ